MGFDEKDAAIALFRTWENPDDAAALLLLVRTVDYENTIKEEARLRLHGFIVECYVIGDSNQ